MKNIDNTKVYNAYSYHRRGGTVRLLGSMTMPSNTKNLCGWLRRCFDIGSSVDTVIIDTVPPTVVPMGCGSQRGLPHLRVCREARQGKAGKVLHCGFRLR